LKRQIEIGNRESDVIDANDFCQFSPRNL
jgi:hypothetical protein